MLGKRNLGPWTFTLTWSFMFEGSLSLISILWPTYSAGCMSSVMVNRGFVCSAWNSISSVRFCLMSCSYYPYKKAVLKIPRKRIKNTIVPQSSVIAAYTGSVENEALENEDRSTKHPNLENEAPKTRKRSTLDRKRSTQISKTKTPKLENEAPKNSTPVFPL